MNQVINRITLDVNKTGTQAFIPAKKNESNARTIAITLTKNGRVFNVEDGNTVIIRAVKPDNTVIYNAAELLDGKIYVDITQQMCTSIGRVLAEVQIIDSDNNVLYTPKFYLIVEGIVYEDESITSTSEYTQLTESINQAQSAIETAQDLSLIERVTELPETGDIKKVYVLEETIPLMVTTGLPEELQTQEAYDTWAAEVDTCASLFKTSNADYPYVLFKGITIETNDYGDDGMYYIKGKYESIPVMYVYDKESATWDETPLLPNDPTAVGDPLIAASDYAGTTEPWETVLKIDRSVGINSGLLWTHGTFTHTTRQASVDYTDSDNTFNIYDGISTLSGVGISYIWDEAAGWILVSDNKEVKEELEELESNINTQISDINTEISGISTDISDIEDNITNITNDVTTIQSNMNTIQDNLACIGIFTVHYNYDQTQNTFTCDESDDDIINALRNNLRLLPIIKFTSDATGDDVAWHTLLPTHIFGESCYNIQQLQNGYQILWRVEMFGGTNDNYKYSFIFNHLANGGAFILGTFTKKAIPSALTEGDNITIENDVISAKDTTYTAGPNINIDSNNVISAAGSNIITPVYIYDSLLDVWTCNTSYADIIDAYNNNKKIIPIVNDDGSVYVCSGNVDVNVSGDIIMYSLTTVITTVMNIYIISHHNNNNVDGSSATINLQTQLTAGDGIDITNGVISVSYDNGDSEVY